MTRPAFFKHWTMFLAGLLALAVAPWFTADAGAQEPLDTKTVIASGYSRIYGNISDARAAAIAESIRFAVQKAAEGLLSEDRVTADFDAVSRVLQGNPGQFVRDYRILRELQVDRSYRVLIQATVMVDRIQESFAAAGLHTRPRELPAVLFMVAEKHLGDAGYRYWWQAPLPDDDPVTAESPMAGVFSNKGFTVIDPQQFMGYTLFFHDGLSLTATPADYEAAIFARRLGAELVVMGTAEANEGEHRIGDDTRTYRGGIHLRVIDTQSGRVLTTLREERVSIGKDPDVAARNAMADAAYQVGIRLAERIETLWTGEETPVGGITISIAGRGILPNLERFRQTVSGLQNIASVRTLRLSTDKATLWVDFRGTPDELADSLLKQSYGPFGINILKISADNLEIEMIRDLTSEILTE